MVGACATVSDLQFPIRRTMKHQRDPEHWQHESMFRCKACGQMVEFNSMVDGLEGPDDCPGDPEEAKLLEAVRNMYPEFEIRRRAREHTE